MPDRLRLITFNTVSVDGRIAVSPSTPSSQDARWKPLDQFRPVDVLALHEARIALEGSNSFTARDAAGANFDDHAESSVPAGDFLPATVRTHPGRWMVAIDSRARSRWTRSEGGGTRLAVLISSATPAVYRSFLRAHDIPYLEVGWDRVDLRKALIRLGEVFGEDCIVSSAGGLLNGALLRQGLVDEVDIHLLPAVIGHPEAPSLFEGYDILTAGRHTNLRLLTSDTRPDGSIFIRYEVPHPSEPG